MTENGKRRCRGTARRHIAQAGTKAMKGTGIPQNITPESASPLPNRVCCHGFVKCLPIAHFWGLWRQRLAILCGAASLTVGGRVGERGPPIRLTRARGETSGGGVTRMSELGWCMCCYNMARSYKLRTAARQARRQPLRPPIASPGVARASRPWTIMLLQHGAFLQTTHSGTSSPAPTPPALSRHLPLQGRLFLS